MRSIRTGVAGTLASLALIFGSGVLSPDVSAQTQVKQTGELKKWHKVTLTFDGPETSEMAEQNPFLHYRLNVTFTHSKTGKEYKVPGYFAADGNAAETSASAGNKWRVHFSADEIGQWQWQASFRRNNFVAVSAKPDAGISAGFMDEQTGEFVIKATDKKQPDFRASGRLQYVNEPYLRFAETGDYFIKAGPDAPENLLSYADFDGSFQNDGHKDELVKTSQPHVKDWKKGDPSWQNGKGKGLIGALNYIASEQMNSISFLTFNVLGDDQNVFPYVNYDTFDRLDVSKLDQWEIIFEHAQELGLFLHFKTQEMENQGLLDGGGLGFQRKLYYRELIARFGHHLALNWNMGEENGEWINNHPSMPQEQTQRLAMAQYFYENDPYQHHRVIHNGIDYKDLFTENSRYTGASVQTHHKDFHTVNREVKRLRDFPVMNGRPWAIAVDEPGDAEHALMPDDMDPEHNLARMNGLWGAMMAGAWGTEWYFGYANAHSDLTAQDWRSRDLFWDQARHCLNFFKMLDVPFQKATTLDRSQSGNAMLNSNNAFGMGIESQFYMIYLKDASEEQKLKIRQTPATYSVQWYDPRNGGNFQQGSIKEIEVNKAGNQSWKKTDISLGLPPNNPDKDWVVLIKRQ